MRNFIKGIRKILNNPNTHQLIEAQDDNFITVMSQRFHTDRNSLRQLIEKVPTRELMVEVGSLAGFSTRFFSLHFDKVISIDPYIPNYDSDDINSNNKRLALASDLFTLRFFDDPKVEQINMPSKVAANEFKNESLDFVYIDGAHDYDSVKSDILSWKPKIKKDSYMAGDDYKWPGLKKAVSEQFPNHEVLSGGARWIAKIN